MFSNQQEIPVSVICATFNQEQYIKDALEGFAKQETSFRFKVYIGDDCSSDSTAKIIRQYTSRYPDVFVPIYRTKNVGGTRNWQDLIARSNSKYLAFCDGDDYWTDPLKLQKQFDYMERNKDLRACFHDAEVKIETSDGTWFQSKDFGHTCNGKILWPSGNKRFIKKETYRIENYIPFGFVHTSSMFIKWDYSIVFPDWFLDQGIGDYPMWLMQIGKGRFGYIDEIMSVHRRVSTSIYHFRDRYDFWQKSKPVWISLDEHLAEHFNSQEYPSSISEALRAKTKDDLAKMIKGIIQNNSAEDSWLILRNYRKIIMSKFNVPIIGKYSKLKARCTIYALKTIAPLPPYTVNKAAKEARKKNRATEQFHLTMD